MFEGKIMNISDIGRTNLAMIVNNVVGGNTECKTLFTVLDMNAFKQHVERSVVSFIAAYENEADSLRMQRDSALKDAEIKRYALEFIASNINNTDLASICKEALATGLPGRKV